MSVGVMSEGWATPTAPETLSNSLRRVRRYIAARMAFEGASMPRVSHGSCVAMPVGHASVWHFCAWIQPMDSIASRPTLTMSTPRANATTAFSGRPSLPEPMKVMSSVSPRSANTL